MERTNRKRIVYLKKKRGDVFKAKFESPAQNYSRTMEHEDDVENMDTNGENESVKMEEDSCVPGDNEADSTACSANILYISAVLIKQCVTDEQATILVDDFASEVTGKQPQITKNCYCALRTIRLIHGVLLHAYEASEFHEEEYEAFLRHAKTASVERFDAHSPIIPPEIDNIGLFNRLQVLKNKITLDVQTNIILRSCKDIRLCKGKLGSQENLKKTSDLPFSLLNVDPLLQIKEDDVFQSTMIFQLLNSSWKTTRRVSVDKIYSAVKFILAQATKDPSNIKRFTHSVGEAPPRIHNPLPHSVEVLNVQLTGLDKNIYAEDAQRAQELYPREWFALGVNQPERMRLHSARREQKDCLIQARAKIISDALCELRRCSFNPSEEAQAVSVRNPKRPRSGHLEASSFE